MGLGTATNEFNKGGQKENKEQKREGMKTKQKQIKNKDIPMREGDVIHLIQQQMTGQTTQQEC